MSKSYAQIQKQIAALRAQADKQRRKEVDDVVARIREAITHYGLTAADLGLARRAAAPAKVPAKKKAKAKIVVPVKYRDEAGHTWTGRGLKPVWLRDALAGGKTLQDFAVK